MSLDNKLSVKRSYAALEPKLANDMLYKNQIEKITDNMKKPSTRLAYKAIFESRKKISGTLRLLSGSAYPGTDFTLIPDPSYYNDADTFANACVRGHSRLLAQVNKKGMFGGYVNKNTIRLEKLVSWYAALSDGPGGIIAALGVFDPGVRSAIQAKPEENLKTTEQARAEKALAEEKKMFLKGKENLAGRLGVLKSEFIRKLKDYNKAETADYKIGLVSTFDVDRESTTNELSFDLDASSTTTTSKVKRLAVLAADSNGNKIIMVESDDRSFVEGPEPFTVTNRNADGTITNKVLIKGNKKYQEAEAAKKKEKDEQASREALLSDFGGVIEDDLTKLQAIVGAMAKKLKFSEDEILARFKLGAKVDHFTQKMGGNREDPSEYFATFTYLVLNQRETILFSVVDFGQDGTRLTVSGQNTAAKLPVFTSFEERYIFINNRAKPVGAGAKVKDKGAIKILPLSEIKKRKLTIIP